LLELQEKNLSDDQAKQALQEGRTRVRSIALIHQNLYQYENLSRIELCSFTNDLYKQVSAMFENKSKDTTAKINIPVTEIDIDTAVPFGLAVNELLTNSFKYGHTTDNSFTIEMTLTSEKYDGEEGNKYIFVYSDTGPGLPAGFDIKKSKSLGMRLVNDLSKQMGGSMRYTFQKGSRFTILFSDKKARKKND
jgi:two-component sensor histidine kinase